MKRILFVTAVTLLSISASFAQSTTHNKSWLDKWPEMKEYKMALAEVFRPALKHNIAEAKNKAPQLYASAKKLAAAKVPAAYSSDKMKHNLQAMEQDAKQFSTMATSNASDEQVKEQLVLLRKEYSAIYRSCKQVETTQPTAKRK